MALPKKVTKRSTAVTPTTATTETPKPRSKTWPFVVFVAAWVIVSMLLSQFVIGIPMMLILGDNFSRPVWTGVYYVLTYALSLFLILFVTPRLSKKFNTTPIELGLAHLPTFVDIGLAPIAYVVYIACANFITSLMSHLPWFNADEAQDVGFNYLAGGGERVIAMLALVFIAPIAEEIIMRGWLYGKIRSKLKVVPAILITSAVFALLHGQWNVAVTTFVLSVVLCGLHEITGTIWSGIILHMLSNGIAFYLLYVVGML